MKLERELWAGYMDSGIICIDMSGGWLIEEKMGKLRVGEREEKGEGTKSQTEDTGNNIRESYFVTKKSGH